MIRSDQWDTGDDFSAHQLAFKRKKEMLVTLGDLKPYLGPSNMYRKEQKRGANPL